MKIISLPSVIASYIEQNVYHIRYSSIDKESIFIVVAPSTFVAVQVFSFIYPTCDILNVACVGSCISLYPSSYEQD